MTKEISTNDLGEARHLRTNSIYTFHDAFVEFIKTTSNREISVDENVPGGCNDCVSTCGFNQGTKFKEKVEDNCNKFQKEINNSYREYILKEKINPLLQVRESDDLFGSKVEKYSTLFKKRRKNKKKKQFRKYETSESVMYCGKLQDKKVYVCDNKFNEGAEDKRKENILANSVEEVYDSKIQFRSDVKEINHLLQERENNELVKSNAEITSSVTKKIIKKKKKKFHFFGSLRNVLCNVKLSGTEVNTQDYIFNQSTKKKKISDNSDDDSDNQNTQLKNNIGTKYHPSLKGGDYESLGGNVDNFYTLTKEMKVEDNKNCPSFDRPESITHDIQFMNEDISLGEKKVRGSEIHNMLERKISDSVKNINLTSKKRKKHKKIEKASCTYALSKSGILDDIKTSKLPQIGRIVNAENMKCNSTVQEKRKTALECFESSEEFIDNTNLPGKESKVVINLCDQFTNNEEIPEKEFEFDLNKSQLLDFSSDVICISPPSCYDRSFKKYVVPDKKANRKKTIKKKLTHTESTGGKISRKNASSSKTTEIDPSYNVNNETFTDNYEPASLSENSDLSNKINFFKSSKKRRTQDSENIKSISTAQKKRILELFESSERFIHNTGLPGKVSKTVSDLTISSPSKSSSGGLYVLHPKSKDRCRTSFKNNFEPIERICKKETCHELLTNNDSTESKIWEKDTNTEKDVENDVGTDEISDHDSLSEVNITSNEISFNSSELQLMTSRNTSLQNKCSESNVSTENVSKIGMTSGNGTLDQDVLLSDDKLNNITSKSEPEFECETKYDERLKEVLSNNFTICHLEKKFFQDLRIVLDHEIPPLHQVVIFPNRGLNREEKIRLSSLGMRDGRFSDFEDSVLMENWEKFSKAYDIPDPLLFINLKNRFGAVKTKFVQFLGNRLPHRALFQIYQRFFWLCHTKRGEYSEDEDKVILKVMEEKIRDPFYVLSYILKRNQRTIRKRNSTLWKLKLASFKPVPLQKKKSHGQTEQVYSMVQHHGSCNI